MYWVDQCTYFGLTRVPGVARIPGFSPCARFGFDLRNRLWVDPCICCLVGPSTQFGISPVHPVWADAQLSPISVGTHILRAWFGVTHVPGFC